MQRMRIFAARGTVLTAGVLGLAAAAAWVLLLSPAQMSGMGGASIGVAAALFMTTWLVMLIAMMVPAMTPMAVTYQRITAARPRGPALLTVFVLGYLIVWSAAGLVPLVFNLALPDLQMRLGMSGWLRLVEVALVAVGLYQLSPAKTACLKSCRSPLGFFMTHDFGAGLTGALRLGGLHGAICLGCCWALMALMVVAGSMSAAWMAVLALVFIAEKLWHYGLALSRVVGVGSLATAAALVIMGGSM
jgi:predicted metal-binding membrane protein